jgi:alpha-tubulin suppressor-like RCC1 family protein
VGQLGIGYQINHKPAPVHVSGMKDKKIIDIVAGAKHSLALTEEYHVYSWGSGENGRLGISDNISKNQPTLIKSLVDSQIRVVQLFCNSSAECSFILTDQHQLLCFGCNKNGQLGQGDNKDKHHPVEVRLILGETHDDLILSNGGAFSLLLATNKLDNSK